MGVTTRDRHSRLFPLAVTPILVLYWKVRLKPSRVEYIKGTTMRVGFLHNLQIVN